MSDQYWVADPEGRVLGPLTLQTLMELVVAGRIRQVSDVSRDGERWQTLEAVPEVSSLFVPPEQNAREKEEATKARQLKAQLQGLKHKPAHEVLGVRVGASLEEHRTAFFALAKRFHPARLPPGTSAPLREACYETFQLLSDLMQKVETQLSPRPPVEKTPTPVGRPSAGPKPPSYDAGDFVGLTRDGSGIEATVRVTPRTASIFTEHHTVNFNNESVFLPTRQHLPLGTVLSVNLIFDNARQIRARARVIWENANENAKAKLGFGVRLQLEKGDRQFIRDYLSGSGGREPTN